MAKQAAEHALQLDPSLSMPWAAIANSEKYVWPVDWPRQFELLDRAIAADSRNATAYLWRGIAWLDLGYFERALADFNRCLELEPNYSNALRHKALALVSSGKVDEALELFERGVAQGFIVSRAENFVGPLVARGDVVAAQLLLDRLGFAPDVRTMLINALKRPRPPSKESVARIDRYLADNMDIPDLQLVRSHPYLWLGDFDRAGAADDQISDALLSWERFPPGFRNSPGFKRKLEDKGVLTYWRTQGFPPQCRAVGDEGFHVRLSSSAHQ